MITKEIHEVVESLTETDLRVSLGKFLDASRQPPVPLTSMPVGALTATVVVDFSQAVAELTRIMDQFNDAAFILGHYKEPL